MDSPEYREAVEYLVQQTVINYLVDKKMQAVVVSRVFASGYEKETYIQEESGRVSADIKDWLVRTVVQE
jgi:hypothetical protein